jgi:hypothetical protein
MSDVGVNGLILLAILAVIFAVLVTRGRRRLGMSVTARYFVAAVAAFAIVVLIFWVHQR